MKNLNTKLLFNLKSKYKINPSSCQINASSKIQEFISNNSKIKLLKLKQNSKNGLYIHGPVGVGKSVIIKALEIVYTDSKMLHFSDLIFNLQSQNKRSINYLKAINKKRLILIDEFFIKDITDLILFGKFLVAIRKNNTQIIMNGNKSIENIYNDPVNPTLCESIKKDLKNFFLIFKVKSKIDFRIGKNLDHNFFLIKNRNKTLKLNYIIKEFSSVSSFEQVEFKRRGNSFKLKKVYGNLIDLEFEDFFKKNLIFQDYELLAKKIRIFILRNIKQIDENKKNIIARFISFIDVLYENKKILSISSNVELDKIYIGSTNSSEFNRTISRLKEMGTNTYINNNLQAIE